MQNFAQQAAMIATVGATGPPLVPVHYNQQQQPSMIHPTQSNGNNTSPNKFIDSQPNINPVYSSSYYVSFI